MVRIIWWHVFISLFCHFWGLLSFLCWKHSICNLWQSCFVNWSIFHVYLHKIKRLPAMCKLLDHKKIWIWFRRWYGWSFTWIRYPETFYIAFLLLFNWYLWMVHWLWNPIFMKMMRMFEFWRVSFDNKIRELLAFTGFIFCAMRWCFLLFLRIILVIF